MLHSRTKATGVGGVNLKDIGKDRPFWIFSRPLLTLNLLLVGALICDITNGYDNSLVNGLQILDTWQNFFSSPEGAWLGLISTSNRLGAIVALPWVSSLMTRLGRRYPIAIGSSIIVLGVVLQAAAQSPAMFMAGRAVRNQMQICACPILIAELAYPLHRATYTSLMNTTGSIGQLVAAWCTYSTSDLEPYQISWRLPVAIQAVSSIFQFVMIFFIPESPRWLVSNGRETEAREILIKYHGEGNGQSELVRFEMAEITYTLETDKWKSSWAAWFRGPAHRHRFAIIFSLGWITQLAGNAIISYYLKLLLESFGITNSKTQLTINACNTVSCFCFAVFFAITIDFFGRRKLFLTGIGGMFCCYVIMTVLAALNEAENFSNSGYAGGAVAMIFCFGAFYKACGTTQDPYISEIASYELRDKAYVIKQALDAAANIFSGFVNPIAMQSISWRYYVPYCCLLVIYFILVFFIYPEVSRATMFSTYAIDEADNERQQTKGLSLEEITQMFDGCEVPQAAIAQRPTKEDASSIGSRKSSAMMESRVEI